MTSPLPYRRYAYVLGILVALGVVAGLFLFARTKSAVRDTKIYTSAAYRFSFEYPASFDLVPPDNFPAAMYDESLPAEERQMIAEKYESERLAELIQINGGLLELGEGENLRQINVSVTDPATTPTFQEEIERCIREDAALRAAMEQNPEGPFEGPYSCPPDQRESMTKEVLVAERLTITAASVGDAYEKPHWPFDDGEVIEVNGVRGVRGFTWGPDTGVYSAAFVTYDTQGRRIDISIDLPLHLPKDAVLSPEDMVYRSRAEDDPRNEALDQIISTFTFLE